MKKSLNDSLRDEFQEILSETDLKDFINRRRLDPNIVQGAFEKLISNERFIQSSEQEIEKSRSEFENFIINTLKSKQH